MEYDFRSSYRILLVNSCGYYKFHVVIGAVAEVVISKLQMKFTKI